MVIISDDFAVNIEITDYYILLVVLYGMLLQRAQAITPDLHTYTSLLSGCGFARDPSTAHDLVSFCSLNTVLLLLLRARTPRARHSPEP